jgi:CubicO group peptidase (beta-lactamase class C family)
VHGFRGYAAGESVPTLVQLLDGAKPANSGAVRVEVKPGQKWTYSGGGFSIGQLVMTTAAAKPFDRLMTDIVLGPLDMKHSTFAQPLPAALHGMAATGHDSAGKPIKGKWHTYPEQAAAGLWTTPSDLARFAIELQQASAGKSDKVISQAMATQMLTRLKGSYGLGIEVDDVGGEPSFSHGGSNSKPACMR